MLFRRQVLASENRDRELEWRRAMGVRRDREGCRISEYDRNDTAHRRDTIERQTLARLLGRLGPLLPHHFHAVLAHLRGRHRRLDHVRARRIGGLLGEEAGERADERRERVSQSRPDDFP